MAKNKEVSYDVIKRNVVEAEQKKKRKESKEEKRTKKMNKI